MKNVKFRGIPQQKDEFCGKFRGSNSAAKTQILRLGSKLRGPRKTVVPTDQPLICQTLAYLALRLLFQALNIKE